MASAEHLLNEAHYAFANISYGESRANKRNAARAKSLCRKIIRRFPDSTEASEARAILRRLGEESPVSPMLDRARETTPAKDHSRRDQVVVVEAGCAEHDGKNGEGAEGECGKAERGHRCIFQAAQIKGVHFDLNAVRRTERKSLPQAHPLS